MVLKNIHKPRNEWGILNGPPISTELCVCCSMATVCVIFKFYVLLVFFGRKRKSHRRTPSSVLQDLVDGEGRDKPPHTILIDQLFSFIGNSPEKAVSTKISATYACLFSYSIALKFCFKIFPGW